MRLMGCRTVCFARGKRLFDVFCFLTQTSYWLYVCRRWGSTEGLERKRSIFFLLCFAVVFWWFAHWLPWRQPFPAHNTEAVIEQCNLHFVCPLRLFNLSGHHMVDCENGTAVFGLRTPTYYTRLIGLAQIDL